MIINIQSPVLKLSTGIYWHESEVFNLHWMIVHIT